MADSNSDYLGVEQLGIGSVLKRYRLSVPAYQREYSWGEEEEAEELYKDFQRVVSNAQTDRYFLGCIVTIKKGDDALEIVDGQQRLATTAMLLAAIRDHLASLASGNVNGQNMFVEKVNGFLTDINTDEMARVPRLRLNSADNAFFEDRVMGANREAKATQPSHKLIDAAATLAAKYVGGIVSNFDKKDHGQILDQWLKFIEHRALVILLKVSRPEDAFRLFETLNDRGMGVSQSDLAKMYTFEQSGERIIEAQHKWASMKGALEALRQKDITILFLRQMLISQYGHMVRSQIYETVQTHAKGAVPALQLLSSLDGGAKDYVAILSPDNEKWNEYPPTMRGAIKTLNFLDIKSFRPLLMSICRTFKPQQCDAAFRWLLNLAVRISVIGFSRVGGPVEETLGNTAKEVSDKTIKDTQELLNALKKITPQDSAFENQMKILTVGRVDLARYYLRSMEMAHKVNATPYLIPTEDGEKLSLEHVLPENRAGNWPGWSEEDADAFYRRLGNLALLPKKINSDLKSSGFATKRPFYAEAKGLYLTSMLASVEGEWDQPAIGKRQDALV